jgi:hypothetical protein
MKAPRASFYFIVGSALGELAPCTENMLDVSGEIAEKVILPNLTKDYQEKSYYLDCVENIRTFNCHFFDPRDSFSKSISQQLISKVGDSFGRPPKRIGPFKKNQKVHRNKFSTRRI